MLEADHTTVSWVPFGPSIVYDVARGTIAGLKPLGYEVILAGSGKSLPTWQETR